MPLSLLLAAIGCDTAAPDTRPQPVERVQTSEATEPPTTGTDPIAGDPTLGPAPGQRTQSPKPAARVATGTAVELVDACYGSSEADEGDLASLGAPERQREIRLSIRESWRAGGDAHPRYVVAPSRSRVEVLRWDGAAVKVRPASGPWQGREVYLPAPCVARGAPVARP